MQPAHVVVYSKPDCCLCDVLKAKLRALQQIHPFEWIDINILEDQLAFEKFRDEIPVVFINGEKAFKFRLDEKKFLKMLQQSNFAREEGRDA